MDRKFVANPTMPAYILDMKGLTTRSYHSGTDSHPIRDEETGERVNSAAHGAANFMERILLPILSEGAPINIIVVADGGNDLRRNIFPAYKMKRKEGKKEHPKAQIQQLELLQEKMTRLLVYLGATAVKVEHREADDVIAALAHSLEDHPKFIYTVDQDLIQLANDDKNTFVTLFDEPRNTFIHRFETAALGKTYHEVEPGLVALYKSLIGDSSDEYGGVKGFGPAKWSELCEVLDTDGLYELDRMVSTGDFTDLQAAVKENPGIKVLNMLLTNSNEWRLMYYLASLHPESMWGAVGKRLIKPIWTKRVPNREHALACLIDLKIDDYLPELDKWFITRTLADAPRLEQVFEHINEHLEDTPAVGFDYEGYDSLKNPKFAEAAKKGEYVDVMSQVVTGASICYGSNLQHSVYFPTLHKDTENIDGEYIAAVINEVQGMGKPLIIQNAGFEMTVTHNNYPGLAEIHRPHDTRVLGSYYDENMMGEHQDGLKDMSWNLLRYRQTEYKELLDQHGAADMRDLTGEQTLEYGADDSITAAHLWVMMRWSLHIEGQWRWFIENHTAPAHIMEYAFRKGVNIDWAEMEKLRAADAIVIEEGNKAIRASLEEKCSEPNPDAVDALIASDIDAIEFQLAEKWAKRKGGDQKRPGRDRMDALVAEVRLKHLEASVYTPYQEIHRKYEFKGTAAQLRDVTAAMGFDPFLDTATNKGIQAWMLHWSDTKLTAQQQEFLIRLGAAIGKPLKSREGPEFADLEEICTEVMQPQMKSDWTGDELNYDSPVQMQQLLYCKLGLPVRRRTKIQRGSFRADQGFMGSPATGKSAMDAALAEDCPPGDWRRDLLETLREVKQAMTRFELYYDPYPLWKHPNTGVIHPGIKDPGTVTRRPTGSRPNILQVSKGPTRRMFIPHEEAERKGDITSITKALAEMSGEAPQIWIPRLPKRLILSPDFSGQELRITGSESKDPELIKAYTGGRRYVDKYGVERLEVTDIHSLTTVKFLHRYIARVLGQKYVDCLPLGDDGRISYEWYTKIREFKTAEQLEPELIQVPAEPLKLLKEMKDARNKMAKPTNFLITYLGTPITLAENTSMPQEFCEDVMGEVFAAYARLAPWQQEVIDFGRRHGYVSTAFGTRKHLSEDILSSDRSLRSREERRACNQVVQGGAADILHKVETDMFESDFLGRFESYFIAPVYDEIDLDVPLNDNLPELIAEMAGMMDITPPGHAIPMMAEFSFGVNWADQYELGERPCERQIEEALSALFTPEKGQKNAA